MTRTCGPLGLDAPQQLDPVDVRASRRRAGPAPDSRAQSGPSRRRRRRCRARESPRRSEFRAATTESAPHHPPPIRSHSLFSLCSKKRLAPIGSNGCAKCLNLAQNLGELLLFYRKLEDESTSSRRVVAHPDEAMMVGDDGRDDRQAEAGAALAWSKSTARKSACAAPADSRAVVAHFERDHAALRDRARCSPRFAAARRCGLTPTAAATALSSRLTSARLSASRSIAIGGSAGVERQREVDAGIGVAKVRDRLLGQRVEVARERIEMRHPGEGREFVHQPL